MKSYLKSRVRVATNIPFRGLRVPLKVPWSFILPEGSWVVISGVIRPLVWVISIETLLITLLITTHEPPNRILWGSRLRDPVQGL